MTPKNESTEGADDDLREARGDAAGGDAEGAAEDLDLDAMDLSVETAEERISPSETNVFAK